MPPSNFDDGLGGAEGVERGAQLYNPYWPASVACRLRVASQASRQEKT